MNAPAAAATTRKPTSAKGELGMWVFLASEVLFFGVLFVGYMATRLHHPQGFAAGSRETDLILGTTNTAVLLTSSLTIALATLYAQGRRLQTAAWLLAITILLGCTFLSLKFLEYAHDYHKDLVPWLTFAAKEPDPVGMKQFFLLYFVMTGAHAVHLIAGLTLVAVLFRRALRAAQLAKTAQAIELGALYWHLVDIIWIFLFPLLYLVSRT